MMERRNSCGVCLRYFLAVTNILFLLLGGGVVAIFIHLYLNQVYFVSTVLVTDLVVASTFLIIVGGGLLVIAALIGFVAVATKCQRVIAAHFGMLVSVFLAVMAGIMCALVFRISLNEEVMDKMQETIWKEYGVDVNTSEWNRRVTSDWDKAQTLWKCCGVEEQGWAVYQNSKWYRLQPGTPNGGKPFVPRTCCVTDSNGLISDEDLGRCQTTRDGPPERRHGSQYSGPDNTSLHYRGCYESSKDYLLHDDLSWFIIVVGVGTTVSAFVLVGIIIAVAYYMLRKKEMKWRAAMILDDTNAQTMVSLSNSKSYY